MEVKERKEVRAFGVYWWSSETDSLKGECFFFVKLRVSRHFTVGMHI